MTSSTLQELQNEWNELSYKIQKQSETEFEDQNIPEMLSELLGKCVNAGQYIAEPGERSNLQWIAQEIGDTIFRITKEYPGIVISPAKSKLVKQSVYTLADSEVLGSININIGDIYLDTGTKGLPRKRTPAIFPNNLNRLGTGAVKFVARDEALEILDIQLQGKGRVSRTVVTGMAGVGKTELVLQYAFLSKEKLIYPGGICWIEVRERSLVEQLLEFAQTQLGLFPPEDWSLEQQLDFCWLNWQPAGDVLIILDDVDKYEEIERYLPPQEQRFKLLITTRRYWLSESLEMLRLEVLDEDAALELLEVLIGESRMAEQREEAKKLCQQLGYLPLGLELVGRFLKRRSWWRLERMIQELEKQALELPALKKLLRGMTATRGMEAALELSWRELDKRARYLGCFLSMFALAPIPWSLVEQCLATVEIQEEGIMQKWFANFSRLWLSLVSHRKANLLESRTWEDVREDSLLDLNLIQRTAEETYQLHPLVRPYFQDKLKQMARVEELRCQFCRGMVVEAKKVPGTPVKAEIEELTLFIPHLAEIATEMQQWLKDEDLIWPFISLGRFYESQGLYELAEPWYQQCLNITRSRLGSQHPDVATSLNNLASLYSSQGRYTEAEPLYLEALEITKQLLDSSHPDVATNLNNLASLYSFQGRYTEAESLYLEALEMRKQLLGEKHPDVATNLNNLASLYNSQGRYTKAEPLYLKALEMRKQLLGFSDPSVATSLNDLASLYSSQGRYKEAEPLYLEALEMRKRLLGSSHPSVATSLNDLASLYSSQGRYKEAESLYKEALEMRKQLLGSSHPFVTTSLNNLAKLYSSQGRYKEAEPLYKEALEMKKQLLGEKHPSVAIALNNLASLYNYQGRYTEAEVLLLEALEMTKQLLGKEHPNTQTFQKNYLYFLQKVLGENRQEDLSDQRSLQIISEMEKSSLKMMS